MTFVPTPSVEVASSGRRIRASPETSNSPAKPPMLPITSGRAVLSTAARIRSTARSPASISTPAPAYLPGTGSPGTTGPPGSPDPPGSPGSSAGTATAAAAADGGRLQDVFALLSLGHRDRVVTGKTAQT